MTVEQWGVTALMYAAKLGHKDIVTAILRASPGINVNKADNVRGIWSI
jgi:ankyrin repeat protein